MMIMVMSVMFMKMMITTSKTAIMMIAMTVVSERIELLVIDLMET